MIEVMPSAAFLPTQIETLSARGITPEAASAVGVISLQVPADLRPGMADWWANHLPGIAFPFTGADGHVEWQFRPDSPPANVDGKVLKYLMRSTADGYKPTLWVAKRGTPNGRRILVEGSCQTVAAATYAPADVWVVGMFGCYGWSDDGAAVPDLWDLQSHQVIVAMDGDMWTNPNVWDAGKRLQAHLGNVGIPQGSIRWAQLASGSKAPGLDDMLARQPYERRHEFLANLLDNAKEEKFPVSRTPKPKVSEDAEPGSSEWFFDSSGLMAQRLADAVRQLQPVALTEERGVACYVDGVYHVSDVALTHAVSLLLKERFRKEYVGTAEAVLSGRLNAENFRLPQGRPMLTYRPALTVANGVLDLSTAQLYPWSPDYFAIYKCPVEWDPAATCPTYESWLHSVIPEQARQFEELMWSMLDCSRTPTKAGFLVGPTRSGKGTALRLAGAIAGQGNVASVSLHQLSDDPFASANLYGKRLNTAGDLSAAHVNDVSVFKQLTGEDLVNANRKYGQQFSFQNQALFLFGANEIPTVSEQSNAYFNRMIPFLFGRSFEGREDPSIEQAMMRELPGILVRWVRAGLALIGGGERAQTPAAVAAQFQEGSDRVRMFLTEMCQTVPVTSDAATPAMHQGTTPSELYQAFKHWVADNGGGHPMGRGKFCQRVVGDPRTREIRIMPSNVRGYNLLLKRD